MILGLALLGCRPPTAPPTSTPASCEPLAPGTYREQTIAFGGEMRTYLLHVPEGTACGAPVLVDLHGALTGVRPEEFYALDQAIQAADAEGYVLLRPRGGELTLQGRSSYYWNVEGERQTNADFIEAVLSELSPNGQLGERWVLGYSSGADLVGWMLSRGRDYAGFGMVGGNLWGTTSWQGFDPDVRVYLQLGGLDGYSVDGPPFVQALFEHGLAPGDLFLDPGNGGHRLDELHYAHALPFFREGVRPGPLPGGSSGWSEEHLGDADLLSLDVATDGALWLGDASGRIWRDGELLAELGVPVTGLCAEGRFVAEQVGELDPIAPIPGLVGYPIRLACDGERTVVVGVSVYEQEQGTLVDLEIPVFSLHDVALEPGGDRAFAVGSYQQHAWFDGSSWSANPSGPEAWMNGAAWGDAAWAVGDSGVIMRSDDGASWAVDRDRVDALPLYAVDAQGSCVVAGGHGGAVWWTDGAGPWAPLHLEQPFFIGRIALVDGTIVAAGQGGRVWRHPWPGGACSGL